MAESLILSNKILKCKDFSKVSSWLGKQCMSKDYKPKN